MFHFYAPLARDLHCSVCRFSAADHRCYFVVAGLLAKCFGKKRPLAIVDGDVRLAGYAVGQ